MHRASASGFGGLFHGNLYGLISANPDILLKDENPIGELNDYYLRKMIKLSHRQLIGWGSFPAVKIRAPKVLQMIKESYCLGVNSDGEPKHPLYISYKQEMKRYVKV